MNYLERLIKRALAQPESRYHDRSFDPFCEVSVEEAQWPAPGMPRDGPRRAKSPDTGQASIPVEPTVEVINSRKVEQKLKPDVEWPLPLTSPVIDDMPQVERTSTATEPDGDGEGPEILNKDSDLSIIDRVIEPHMETFRRANEIKKNEAITPVGTSRTVTPPGPAPGHHDDAANVRRSAIQSQRVQPERNPSLPPRQRQAPEKPEQGEPVEYRARQEEILEEYLTRRTEKTHQENRVIVVHRSGGGTVDGKDPGSGSPHIGIGQL